MTEGRVYRPAKTKEEAIEELINCKSTAFDSVVVDALVEVLNS